MFLLQVIVATVVSCAFVVIGYPLYTSDFPDNIVVLSVLICVMVSSFRFFIIFHKKRIFAIYKWVQLIIVASLTPLVFPLVIRCGISNVGEFVVIVITWGISVVTLLVISFNRTHQTRHA